MSFHPRPSSILLLFCTALFADAALGQPLSIIRKGGSEIGIEATAPPDTRYVLQASENMHLWVDIQDEVLGQVSYRFDSAGVTKRFFRLTSWTPPAPSIMLMVLGDSTATDEVGWGQGLYGFFKPNVRVVNYAERGQSTKLFLSSDAKAKMLVVKPNFVLVQFGMLDGWPYDNPSPLTTTTPVEYRGNLLTIVQLIRSFNGIPILITPHAPRWYDDQEKVVREQWLLDRCAIIKTVATELKTPFIDLYQPTMDLYNELGASRSAFIVVIDGRHFSPAGAQVIAGLVVNALPDSLGTYMVGILNQPPIP